MQKPTERWNILVRFVAVAMIAAALWFGVLYLADSLSPRRLWLGLVVATLAGIAGSLFFSGGRSGSISQPHREDFISLEEANVARPNPPSRIEPALSPDSPQR